LSIAVSFVAGFVVANKFGLPETKKKGEKPAC
jgi:hypothetical protein